MKIRCPHCETPIKVLDEHAGRKVRCPSCKEAFMVPVSEEEEELEEIEDSSPPSKGEIPIWVWIAGGIGASFFLCCGGLLAIGLLVQREENRQVAATTQPAVAPSEKPRLSQRLRASKEAEPEIITPEVGVTADDLYADYQDNPIAADQKYKGKYVAISGIVQTISSSYKSATVSVGSDKFGLRVVYCQFDLERQQDALARLTKGQEVFIVGKCTGRGLTIPRLTKCQVMQE